MGVFEPAVEDAAEEVAVLLRGDGEFGDLPGLGVFFNTGDELPKSELAFEEEVENFIGFLNVPGVEQDEDVKFDLMFDAAVDGVDDSLP